MRSIFLASLAVMALIGQAQAAVYPAEVAYDVGSGDVFDPPGFIKISGTTTGSQPTAVSVELTVSGDSDLRCDSRYSLLYCSNYFYFSVIGPEPDFDEVFSLSGGNFIDDFGYEEKLPDIPTIDAEKTAVILNTVGSGSFTLNFQTYNQGLDNVGISARILTDDTVSAVPLPASSIFFGSGLAALMAMRRRRLPTGPARIWHPRALDGDCTGHKAV